MINNLFEDDKDIDFKLKNIYNFDIDKNDDVDEYKHNIINKIMKPNKDKMSENKYKTCKRILRKYDGRHKSRLKNFVYKLYRSLEK